MRESTRDFEVVGRLGTARRHQHQGSEGGGDGMCRTTQNSPWVNQKPDILGISIKGKEGRGYLLRIPLEESGGDGMDSAGITFLSATGSAPFDPA